MNEHRKSTWLASLDLSKLRVLSFAERIAGRMPGKPEWAERSVLGQPHQLCLGSRGGLSRNATF